MAGEMNEGDAASTETHGEADPSLSTIDIRCQQMNRQIEEIRDITNNDLRLVRDQLDDFMRALTARADEVMAVNHGFARDATHLQSYAKTATEVGASGLKALSDPLKNPPPPTANVIAVSDRKRRA